MQDSLITINAHSARHVSASRGLEWYKEAWALFKKAPLELICLPLIYFVIAFICGLIPLFGFILQIAVGLVFTYGSIYLVADLDRSGKVRWAALLDPFKERILNMIGFSILKIVVLFLSALIIIAVIAALAANQLPHEYLDPSRWSSMSSQEIPALLFSVFTLEVICITSVLTAVFAFLYGAIQFMGDSLVALTNANPFSAAGLSIQAIFKNSGSLTVAGLIGIGLLIPVALTLGIGFLIYLPLIPLVVYRAFRDIYAPETASFSAAPL